MRSGSFEAKERNNSYTYESREREMSCGTGKVYFNTEYCAVSSILFYSYTISSSEAKASGAGVNSSSSY